MKKKLIIAMLGMTMLASLNGCLSKEEKEEGERYAKQAEKNAVEYIKEKYDIEAKAVDSSYNSTGMFAETLSSYVDVEMEYDGKKFDVYMVGSKEWKDVEERYKNYNCDNYQYDEIYDDLKNYIEDKTKVNIEELDIWYNDTESYNLEHMTYEYYDGNLEEFLGRQYVSAVAVTTDEEAGEFSNVDMIDGSLSVYSYEEDYYEKYGHTVTKYNEYLCALWMNWTAEVDNDRSEVIEYEKKKFDLGYLVYPKGCDVDVSKTTVDVDDWEKDKFDNLKKISDAYKICGDTKEIFVYINSDNDDEFIGVEYEYNGKMSHGRVGKYEKEYIKGELDMKKYEGEVNIVVLED